MSNNQIHIPFGDWERQLGAEKFSEFQAHALRFFQGYEARGRGYYTCGLEGMALIEIGGETLFYSLLRGKRVSRAQADKCLDIYALLQDCVDDVTPDEWIAIDQLMTHVKINRQWFRDAVGEVIGSDDPAEVAQRHTEKWSQGKHDNDPPEAEIEDKARRILEAAGFRVTAQNTLDNGTVCDLVAEKPDLKLECECKKFLTIPDLTKALGQLRAYSYCLPGYQQVIFYGQAKREVTRLARQATEEGVWLVPVGEQETVEHYFGLLAA